MSTRRENSEWREKRFTWHGEAVWDYLREEFHAGELFTVTNAAAAKCLRHLSDRYAYDVAIAVCSELYIRNILHRQGNNYYFPRKARAA
jgi:hypothetical protein